MKKKRLFWRIYPLYLIVAIFSLGIGTWYAVDIFKEFYWTRTSSDLEDKARLIANPFYGRLNDRDMKSVDSLCKVIGKNSPTRITVILPSGKVLGDSKSNADTMENHGDRPEILKALTGQTGMTARYSFTRKENMMYVAIPLMEGSRTVGALRASVSLSFIENGLTRIYEKILAITLLTLLLAALASYFLTRRIARPIEQIKAMAERFAKGELHSKVPMSDIEEIGKLVEAMNTMALQLDDRIKLIEQQKNTQEAIFSSMAEGVIAVDPNESIISINKIACAMLGLPDSEAVKGRRIHEVLRNREIQQFIEKILATQGSIEEEMDLLLTDNARHHFYARGVSIFDGRKKEIGGLMVLNDITRLKKLENIRRDFVANVSHELRTPITSIKGYTETLLSEADRLPFVQESRDFLEIILKQADRLNSLIEDLMTLSKIEQSEEKGSINLEEYPISEVLRNAVQICRDKAKEHGIEIETSCENSLALKINPLLLEQAVTNLLDNAIKYSSANGKIMLNCASTGTGIVISVRDRGLGIAAEHIPHLFERFYRVDKARSRKMGGTGLGLAIVKHIVQAHGGRVTVESELNKGSTFTIHLNK